MVNWNEIDRRAKEWVKEAGERIRASFPKTLNIRAKSNRNDLVTNIDEEIEQLFIEKIRKTYPDHQILGEEGYGDQIDQHSGIVWIIDPIDGTMNFIHQQRNFAISVGIYEDGFGKIALIYDVAHDELYHAKKGMGAFMNDEPLPKLEEVDVHDALLGINATWILGKKHMDPALLISLMKDVRGTRSYGSAALEMVYVATGRMDAYISLRLSPWDYAAGILLIEELGGEATTLKGEKLGLLKPSTLFVSKPGLHQKILKDYLRNGNW